ncbi:PKD domain-containing protein [Pelagicoccus sp. SDUM812003]|uniref:PKD domain-containing protein n=1 Tax=Pelagicoccus sp. SDUM812003 TaxID=3041267 RepID=UPI00280D1DC3|nr:PKD domain-containing protein [Pelagicoccus sp. SDUM812003]MDQ8202691.1 PKD domain-containing protein [Pelagicoccus sp. SDUM812003]
MFRSVSLLLSFALFVPALEARPTPIASLVGFEENQTAVGTAPFTIHVHGLDSILDSGTIETTRFSWDFGDSGADFNTLLSWGGAHTFDTPGVYTITLNVTQDDGQTAIATRQVTVMGDNRQRIYVSAEGDDGNDGLSFSAPVRSPARIQELLTSDQAILFHRGQQHDFSLSQLSLVGLQNVLIGAYGEGDRPVLYGPDLISESAPTAISIDESQGITVQDLVFSSPSTPQWPEDADLFKGVATTGETTQNITVRRCHFGNVGFSTQLTSDHVTGVRPSGYLMQGNTAGLVGRYLLYGSGYNITLLDNETEGTYAGHSARLFGERIFVLFNRFETNSAHLQRRESEGQAAGFAVDLVDGRYAYLGDNDLNNAVFVGYETHLGISAWRNAVIARNRFTRAAYHYFPTIRIMPDSDDVHIRANLFLGEQNGIRMEQPGAGVDGYDNRVGSVWITHNTVIYEGTAGEFLNISGNPAETERYTIANNLIVAPNFAGQSIQSWDPNFIVADEPLANVSFHGNRWQTPASGMPFRIAGEFLSPSAWLERPEVENDAFHSLELADLNGFHAPEPTIEQSLLTESIPWIRDDFHQLPVDHESVLAGALQAGSAPVAFHYESDEIDGIATLSGQLTLHISPRAGLAIDDTLTVLEASGIEGRFANPHDMLFESPDLFYVFKIEYTDTTVTLTPREPGRASDGTPNWWLQEHFLTTTLSDTDGDGFDERQEYLSDTNPLDSRSFLPAPEIAFGGSALSISWPDCATRQQWLQQATTPKAEIWETVPETPTRVGDAWEVRLDSSDRRFFRLVRSEF